MSVPSLSRLLFLIVFVVPLAAWFVVKPVRVVAPRLAGMMCPTPQVCVESSEDTELAVALYNDAVAFVSEGITPLRGKPKVAFCSSTDCARHFGLGNRAAVTVGKFGTVIGPDAWKAHFLRHELIHYLQSEQLGSIELTQKPRWFVEGMAYELSRDEDTLITGVSEKQRRQFAEWDQQVDPDDFWGEADKL